MASDFKRELESATNDVISSSRNIPIKVQEEIASILNYELINGQPYVVKDSDKLIGRLGIFYPILIYLRHNETWEQIREISSESPGASVEIYKKFLTKVFGIVDRFPNFKYKVYDELSNEMNDIFLEFEKLLEESEKLWGRDFDPQAFRNIPDFSDLLLRYEDILNDTINFDALNSDEIKQIQSAIDEANSNLDDILNFSDALTEEQKQDANDLKDFGSDLEKSLDESLKDQESSVDELDQDNIKGSGESGEDGTGEGSEESGEDGNGEDSGESSADGKGEGSGESGEDGTGEGSGESSADGKGEGSGESSADGNGKGSGEDDVGEGSAKSAEDLRNKIAGKLKSLKKTQESGKSDSEFNNKVEKFNKNKKSRELINKLLSDSGFDEVDSMISSINPHLETIELLNQLYPGRGWNYSLNGISREYYDNIEKYAGLIEKNKDLKEILKLIGRIELEYGIKKISVSPSGKSEMHSVTYSNDISRMLPYEASKLLNPTLKKKFYADFSEGKLLTYQLRGKYWSDGKPKKRQRGPVIALVDTSGSMYGAPETIAKAVIIAITKKMLKEKRDVKVILFSGPYQTVEIELTSKKRMADEFLDFILMSFTGGTDFNTALHSGLESLEKPEYEGADLLYITDGFSAISDKELLAKWDEIKEERNARVFSMIVGNDDAGGLKEISDYTYFIQSSNEWTLKNSPSSMIKFMASPDNIEEKNSNFRKLH